MSGPRRYCEWTLRSGELCGQWGAVGSLCEAHAALQQAVDEENLARRARGSSEMKVDELLAFIAGLRRERGRKRRRARELAERVARVRAASGFGDAA